MPDFDDPKVAAVFGGYSDRERRGLMALRALIFEVAEQTEGVGALEETLKWGQPAYLTSQTKSGSTIRLGISKQRDFALFTHCQTTIMSDFQALFPQGFDFEGNRAVHFDSDADLPKDELRLLIKSALTYHLAKVKS